MTVRAESRLLFLKHLYDRGKLAEGAPAEPEVMPGVWCSKCGKLVLYEDERFQVLLPAKVACYCGAIIQVDYQMGKLVKV